MMGSDANRLRKKWQDYSGKNASIAEFNFFQTFQLLFEDTEFVIRAKPKEFNAIYVDIKLNEKEI